MLPDADKKKKFVPNLNVQRKEAKASTEKPADATPSSSSGGWKKGPKANGRGFNKAELIQTSGTVFAEGMGSVADMKRRDGSRGGGGGGSSESRSLERPKMNLNAKYDKAEEEKKLKDLLRDDFIDDLKSGNLVPIQLPMVDTGKCFKEEQVKTEPLDKDDIIKSAKMKKNRILDSDDDEDSVVVESKKAVITPPRKEPTLSELIHDQKGELLFFQLPDHLPGVPDIEKMEDGRASLKTVLQDLPEGYLGKIQVRKSGKAQLWISNMVFDLDIGTQVGFLQELYSISDLPTTPDPEARGQMTNLGRVRNRVITMPAMSELFSAANFDEGDSSTDDDEEDS